MMRKRASTSLAVREEVGSSRISTRQLADTALAISTDCIWETLSSPTFCFGSKCIRTFFSSSSVSAYILAWSTIGIKPRTFFMGYRPRKMFSPTVRAGMGCSSWCTMAIPFFRASMGSLIVTGSPSIRICPSSIL